MGSENSADTHAWVVLCPVLNLQDINFVYHPPLVKSVSCDGLQEITVTDFVPAKILAKISSS